MVVFSHFFNKLLLPYELVTKTKRRRNYVVFRLNETKFLTWRGVKPYLCHLGLRAQTEARDNTGVANDVVVAQDAVMDKHGHDRSFEQKIQGGRIQLDLHLPPSIRCRIQTPPTSLKYMILMMYNTADYLFEK